MYIQLLDDDVIKVFQPKKKLMKNKLAFPVRKTVLFSSSTYGIKVDGEWVRDTTSRGPLSNLSTL